MKVLIITLAFCLLPSLPAQAGCGPALKWVAVKARDPDAMVMPERLVNSGLIDNGKGQFVTNQHEDYRELMQTLAEQITRIPFSNKEGDNSISFLKGLYRTIDKFVLLTKDDKEIYLDTFGLEKKSNGWVIHLMTDYLYENHPETLFKLRFVDSTDPYEVVTRGVDKIVYVDDAIYSGEQAGRILGFAHKDSGIKKAVVLIPFSTSHGQERIRNDVGVKGMDVVFVRDSLSAADKGQQTIESAREIANRLGFSPETMQKMDDLFGNVGGINWKDKTLTYFDHKVPDHLSILSVHAPEGHFMEGPILNGNGDLTTVYRQLVPYPEFKPRNHPQVTDF